MCLAKAQLMVMYGHKKKHLEDQLEVHIRDALLHKQDLVKNLEVSVGKHLSWKSHVVNSMFEGYAWDNSY